MHPNCFDSDMYRDDKSFREAWDRSRDAQDVDWNESLRWAKIGRKIAPESAEFRYRHAFALERLGRPEEAIAASNDDQHIALRAGAPAVKRYNHAIQVFSIRSLSLSLSLADISFFL